jgi:hypothetical protein
MPIDQDWLASSRSAVTSLPMSLQASVVVAATLACARVWLHGLETARVFLGQMLNALVRGNGFRLRSSPPLGFLRHQALHIVASNVSRATGGHWLIAASAFHGFGYLLANIALPSAKAAKRLSNTGSR